MGPALKGQDRIVAVLMVSAVGVFVGSLFVGATFGWAGLGSNGGVQTAIAVWIAGFVIGFLLFVSGLVLGLVRAKGIGASQVETRVEDTKIVAISALNPEMNPIWNEETYSEDEIKRYVHLRFPDGHVTELRIDKRMLDGIGEGMRGNAILYRDWMVGFEVTGI